MTQGPQVAAFEKAFARYTGAEHACAVSNCTAALHLALQAVGVDAGDVVLTVSMSFIATANAIRHCGAEPVFVDIDPATLNMCPDDLALRMATDFEPRDGSLWYRHVERLTASPSPLRRTAPPLGRLAAILVVHQVGMPCDLRRIMPLARQYGLPVVEDAACAIGSEISLDGAQTWQRVGCPVGDVVCFSFHPRKVITTGDGGMLTTQNAELDRTFRLLRQHGMSLSDISRHNVQSVVFEDYEITGFNHRMTDLQAAIGLIQLEKLPSILEERKRVATAYRRLLRRLPVRVQTEPDYARFNWQSFQVQLEEPALQRPVMSALLAHGIHSRRGVMTAHREPPYRAAWPEGSLPASEKTADCGIILPLFPTMSEEQVRRVVDALTAALCSSTGVAA
ncbi:MAG: DegT/DnrJ/EryC1/StrS family aminotransferase [Gemmataceae bacterium]